MSSFNDVHLLHIEISFIGLVFKDFLEYLPGLAAHCPIKRMTPKSSPEPCVRNCFAQKALQCNHGVSHKQGEAWSTIDPRFPHAESRVCCRTLVRGSLNSSRYIQGAESEKTRSRLIMGAYTIIGVRKSLRTMYIPVISIAKSAIENNPLSGHGNTASLPLSPEISGPSFPRHSLHSFHAN